MRATRAGGSCAARWARVLLFQLQVEVLHFRLEFGDRQRQTTHIFCTFFIFFNDIGPLHTLNDEMYKSVIYLVQRSFQVSHVFVKTLPRLNICSLSSFDYRQMTRQSSHH